MALKKKKHGTSTPELERELSFTATEAYKMLRTKLNLVVSQRQAEDSSGEHTCRFLGITSSMRGEGKSTTAQHLASSFAEAGHRVCILEADMRLPNLAQRLKLNAVPGLSNILSGQCNAQEGLQRYEKPDGTVFYAITAGDVPPLPSELLESRAMERLLTSLSHAFDYVIVDLPPVTLVTDALSVSKHLDGMLLVIRENYCDKRALRDALYQFQVTGTRVIGIVVNASGSGSSVSYSYRTKRSYGYRKYGQYAD